jgi:hypothetical protein
VANATQRCTPLVWCKLVCIQVMGSVQVALSVMMDGPTASVVCKISSKPEHASAQRSMLAGAQISPLGPSHSALLVRAPQRDALSVSARERPVADNEGTLGARCSKE